MNASHVIDITYGLEDNALGAALDPSVVHVVLFHRGCRFILVVTDRAGSKALSGELGKSAATSLRKLAKAKKVFAIGWPNHVSDRPKSIDPALYANAVTVSFAFVSSWIKDRATLMKAGRGPSLNNAERDAVLHDAMHVCMYQGCGKRVNRIANTPLHGNVGQLAHIVGAHPGGPRGRADSHQLSGKASNIMLVCYDHHRLIDAIDPDKHTIAELEAMRASHVTHVNALLSRLTWPRARPLVIRGGIAGQSTSITNDEIFDSLSDMRYTIAGFGPTTFSEAMVERNQGNYGESRLTQLKAPIGRLIEHLRSGEYARPDEHIAVYPLHDLPILVLAGRIVGEGRSTLVMQRNRANGDWRWQAPHATAHGIEVKLIEKQVATTIRPKGLLTLCLSDRFQKEWLPKVLDEQITDGEITWLSIEAATPGPDVIVSPEDHRHVMKMVREALRKLQGDFTVNEIALIPVVPGSIAFSTGQALQAGNHTTVKVYHRSGFGKPFEPAIAISGQAVESADLGREGAVSVPLQ